MTTREKPHTKCDRHCTRSVLVYPFAREDAADLLGIPLINRTVQQAHGASTVDRVIVATDDVRIRDAVVAAGGEAIMTSPNHVSGSDRVAEVAEQLPGGSIIVNVQGDEPLISPDTIDRAVNALLADPESQMATTCEPITSKNRELLNGNVVKVVVSDQGNAVYFSRSPIPFPREAALMHDGDPGRALDEDPSLLSIFRKHTGLYVYRREYLLEFARMPPTRLEKIEMLEQLRALENGARIKVVEASSSSLGVDTQADLERVRGILAAPGVTFRRAEVFDMPRVAEVHIRSWQESFIGIAPQDYLDGLSIDVRTTRLQDRLERQPYSMTIAEHPTEGIAGFLDFGPPDLECGRDVQIYSFYLLSSYQRLGIGQRLFSHCMTEIARSGARSVCLDSLAKSPYRAFYDKMGGKVIGTGQYKLGNEDFETVVYGWDDISSWATG